MNVTIVVEALRHGFEFVEYTAEFKKPFGLMSNAELARVARDMLAFYVVTLDVPTLARKKLDERRERGRNNYASGKYEYRQRRRYGSW